MSILLLRKEIDRIKSGNTIVGLSKDSQKLGGMTKEEIIASSSGSGGNSELGAVDAIQFNNLTVLGEPIEGKQVFSGISIYLATNN